MSKIEIRGIIVPSDFDIGSLADYIEKGIITPESKVRAELKAGDNADALGETRRIVTILLTSFALFDHEQL